MGDFDVNDRLTVIDKKIDTMHKDIKDDIRELFNIKNKIVEKTIKLETQVSILWKALIGTITLFAGLIVATFWKIIIK